MRSLQAREPAALARLRPRGLRQALPLSLRPCAPSPLLGHRGLRPAARPLYGPSPAASGPITPPPSSRSPGPKQQSTPRATAARAARDPVEDAAAAFHAGSGGDGALADGGGGSNGVLTATLPPPAAAASGAEEQAQEADPLEGPGLRARAAPIEIGFSGGRPQRFDWFAQWWPVAPVELMDASRPHPFTLLGQDLVLWRDGSGQWRAFRDACPHRMAPLSEGRIEKDGQLLCAYHGWRFDGKGTCTEIPTARTPDQLHRATSSPRSCATAHPTLQRGGLLWVWGQGGPGAEEAAAAKQPYLPPEIQVDGTATAGVEAPGWTFRDLPYGHNYFIENVVDPAHVPVSHHNVAGDRYKDARPFGMELTRPVSLEGGFETRTPDPWTKGTVEASTAFKPPAHVRIQQIHTNGGKTILALYSTPTRPGWTRHVGQQLRVAPPGSSSLQGTGFSFFSRPLPQWLTHTLSALFYHQDMVFLHHQERIVAREAAARQGEQAGAGASPSSPSAPVPPPKYFMPTGVDRGVTAWRSWLSTFAGGDVQWAPGTPPLGPRETDPTVLFDTYHTHTKQCVVCSAALARLRLVRAASTALGMLTATLALAAAAVRAMASSAAATPAAAVATASAPLTGGGGGGGLLLAAVARGAAGLLGSGEGLALALAALLCAGVAAAAGRLERLMHVHEYSHQDNA
ncbi:hypothetical protein HYH03_016492 [Edaphochlamys debaryana]|uniref:Rieske domain-containing protein n=1 Tax=Edaphochlamys debaryana TaxID=47281 RepID=A0A835XPP7_9CHLO|nr:hypothetical protein HYH03_016492 [Edaphochlamys debaryana]|eukprot:KAG2484745.1 hypothetical protein HYH03_016492 [Edaphochlamys debaryana]